MYLYKICNNINLVVIKLCWNANEWPHDGEWVPSIMVVIRTSMIIPNAKE